MMKKNFSFLLAIAAVGFSLVLAPQAQALVEARVTYGLLAGKPDLSSLVISGAPTAPSVSVNYGIGADVLVVIPIVGLGAGLRYENFGFKVDNSGLEYKTTTSRTAVLVNYRLINTLLYLGPIFSYGISHSNNMTVSYNGTIADLSPDSTSSYTAGLEFGAKLGGFQVGAEGGYESFKWKKMTDKNNVITNQPDLDMSGSYFKVTLGFGI